MKLRAIALLLMVFYDFSLHAVDVFNKIALHPLYPIFPLFGFVEYNVFWMIYYGIATLFALTLLGSGTTIKNTTITHTHIHPKETIINSPKVKKESGGETPADLEVEVQNEPISNTN